jgi:putative ATPase
MLTPLASVLRPHSIDDIVGQEHLFGVGRSLRRYIESGHIPSMILWGPPGCGKTSIASVISKTIDADFYHLSGVLSKKEDLTKILVKAKKNYSENRATILFLDEIHRWNKAQQDVLLPFVEKGIITLIGATTENPSFTVNNALISRARVYILEPISEEHIVKFLERNMSVIGERYPKIIFSPESLNLIASLGQGDLRGTLNLLEAACALQ